MVLSVDELAGGGQERCEAGGVPRVGTGPAAGGAEGVVWYCD